MYPVKGLVVGYVQSGKTAHFTGVIAKAIDSGYKLIIVLAGTLNILRRQTQRRLDKELVGKEQLPAAEYANDSDWSKFLSHGGRPSELGSFDIERLTGLEDDYKPLRSRQAALRFTRVDPGLPFNHPRNLSRAPARLVVIKKLPKIIEDLNQDLIELKKQGAKLDEIPTLVIDDESDQASVNTVNPTKAERDQRTATNGAIVDLLKQLPRAQYVGYTATPFANVFIDPDDAEQLFPKDFIVSLPRPQGYMGVRDFFDFDSEEGQPGENERRHVRFVRGDDGFADNLPRAIDLFVLTGAIKLFRHKADPALRFKHHTMLVHHAAQTEVHEQQRDAVAALVTAAAFTSGVGLARLEALYESDIAPQLDPLLPNPRGFTDLRPYISLCIAKLQQQHKVVRIVNGDERNIDDTPDFDGGPVWAILIGGTKLSRGYTVEGLTISYYRRRAGAGDTLMQMGRWFGFRAGYKDLVRWFVGVEEPIGKSGKTANLYLQFRALCRDEEALRSELTRYADDRSILPRQVPPLVHSHLPSLKPTAKNKMYNAVLKFKNLGGRWVEKAKVAVSATERSTNLARAAKLLASLKLEQTTLAARSKGSLSSFGAYVAAAAGSDVLHFLSDFKWADGARSFQHEMEYLSGNHGDTGITRWLVVVPQVRGKDLTWAEAGLANVTVAARGYDDETGFSVFSEPRHRELAKLLGGVPNDLTDPSESLIRLAEPGTAVLFLFLVHDKRLVPSALRWSEITLGVGLQLPPSRIPQQVVWTVMNESQKDAVVVDS